MTNGTFTTRASVFASNVFPVLTVKSEKYMSDTRSLYLQWQTLILIPKVSIQLPKKTEEKKREERRFESLHFQVLFSREKK